MLLSSKMEGGANVISEALTARVPVIASGISGNVGMLGRDYRGYYPVSDVRALARLLNKMEMQPQFLAVLRAQCAKRRKLISATQEKRGLRMLLAGL
jgi:glycosyltransferase involved in cell wall biosynthesis